MTSTTQSVPAPVGGVNARDSLAQMPPTDAISMDNMFPTPSYVEVRNGNELWASGLPSNAETVMAYNGFTVRKMFAASGTGIYDITIQGAVGSAVTTISNSRLQHGMFNAGGGNELIWVNGADTPQYYNGTTGNINTTGTLVGGSGYANATYTAVPLTGGTGTGALATVVVVGGAVTGVTITSSGQNYVVADTLSATTASLGGSGSGFTIKVATIYLGWQPTTISGSGLTPSNLITMTVHQQRCWYIENNTMNVWYSAALAFQGVLTNLPLGSLFKMGGYLMQMASWTIDNVDGINDFAAFITSEGEVALYQGFDPSSSTTWSLVGIFKIGRPIGRRCIAKFGSDILVINADGLTPLSKALLTDRTQPGAQLTYKVVNAINMDVQGYAANFGWQCIEYPLGNKLILNVPEVSDSVSHQWVMNNVTNSWCRFRNWNAYCWEIQQDALYFGTSTAVYLADTGLSDSGTAITIDCKPAFSYFDAPGKQKIFKMVRPIFQATSAISIPVITMNTDFADVVNQSPPLSSAGGAPWNTSPWNTTSWGGGLYISSGWECTAGIGYVGTGRLSLQINGIGLQWFSTDYMYESGGPL